MRTSFRAGTPAGLVVVTGVLTGAAVTPAAAVAAPGGSCCIRTGDGPGSPGRPRSRTATRTAPQWDGYHCTPGTGAYAGQAQVMFWLFAS